MNKLDVFLFKGHKLFLKNDLHELAVQCVDTKLVHHPCAKALNQSALEKTGGLCTLLLSGQIHNGTRPPPAKENNKVSFKIKTNRCIQKSTNQ